MSCLGIVRVIILLLVGSNNLAFGSAPICRLCVYLRLRTGQPLDYRTVVRRHFKPLLAKAGLPNIRLYDLRHTCATLLLSRGEHPKIVGERLGHSSTTLTLDTYSHVLPDMQHRAAEKLEETLFG